MLLVRSVFRQALFNDATGFVLRSADRVALSRVWPFSFAFACDVFVSRAVFGAVASEVPAAKFYTPIF